MDESNPFGGDLDPDIAELMGIDEDEESSPGFDDLFGDGPKPQSAAPAEEVNLEARSFAPISKFHEDRPAGQFNDPKYYQKVLSGEGDPSQSLHKYLTQFVNAQDPKDKSMYRMKVTAAYWNVMESIASRVYADIPREKLLALRFGYVLPTICQKELRETVGKIVHNNDTPEPVHYVDEWLRKVASGSIQPSATDETKGARRQDGGGSKISAQLQKLRGQKEIYLNQARTTAGRMASIEQLVSEQAMVLRNHQKRQDMEGLIANYDAGQRRAMSEITNNLRDLSNLDRELERSYRQLEKANEEVQSLTQKAKAAGEDVAVDGKVVGTEFNTIRQMHKMTVGRKGNHFPILMKGYARPVLNEIGTRENIISQMAMVENIDPGLFLRTYKRQTNRIVPHVVLVPSYGNRGICWEPWEKFNKATSRGRISIPMYPKDLRMAVITALADLRWQVAKDTAQHYWMEEGLTGYYYQWFTSQKIRGDVKEYFIQDYVLWITKESEGTQKLDKEVRGIFWRHIPFRQDLKDNLRNRGFVYNELYKKDMNRAISDGY